jgi:uncharacterized secreted protein with C-terminal beta-propeller domain
MSVEWLCSRCAEKESKAVEPDPVILRLCTSCKVENWVRPFGHAGEQMMASDEEEAAAVAKAREEAKLMRAAREKYLEDQPKKVTEEIEKAKEEIAAVDVSDEVEVVAVIDENQEGVNYTSEPEEDPYKDMTKAQLLEELKRRG